MFQTTSTNVNQALPTAINTWFKSGHTRDISPRGQRTIELTEPFATTYLYPWQRVLFNATRDANHYFHFFESMWILAGRDDVGFLKCILPRIAEYSDDGKVFHGAYGLRLRHANQLDNAIYELKRDPNSRRSVVTLWTPDSDSGYVGKDMPCNIAVTFKIRDEKLRMTVFNRSNDAIWGAYGANAVQFSFLQEYVATALKVKIGPYTQISDSFHIYPDNAPCASLLEKFQPYDDPYSEHMVDFFPMVGVGETLYQWEQDLYQFFRKFDGKDFEYSTYRTEWWNSVADPLWCSLQSYKSDNLTAALVHAKACRASDWSLAVMQWLQRRIERRAESAK